MRVVDSGIVGSGESGATPRARSDCAFTTVSLIDDATLVAVSYTHLTLPTILLV